MKIGDTWRREQIQIGDNMTSTDGRGSTGLARQQPGRAIERHDARLPLYLQVATMIEEQIRAGTLRVGDKAPSIRTLRRQQRVSVSTVLQAYFWLENRGCIEARARSGFYVRRP